MSTARSHLKHGGAPGEGLVVATAPECTWLLWVLSVYAFSAPLLEKSIPFKSTLPPYSFFPRFSMILFLRNLHVPHLFIYFFKQQRVKCDASPMTTSVLWSLKTHAITRIYRYLLQNLNLFLRLGFGLRIQIKDLSHLERREKRDSSLPIPARKSERVKEREREGE